MTIDDVALGSIEAETVGRRVSMLAGSQLPLGSVMASVASRAPLAMSGSKLAFCASVPAFRIAFAASTVVEKYGAHKSARPNSSVTMHSSTMPKPAPPYCSGIWMPGSASSSLSLAPDRGIVALGGGHQAANLGGRRFVSEKSPQRRAELLLLVGERELDAARGLYFRFV